MDTLKQECDQNIISQLRQRVRLQNGLIKKLGAGNKIKDKRIKKLEEALERENEI